MEIDFLNGRWLVNGKRLEEMTLDEKNYLDDFFRDYKINVELYKVA